MKRSRNERDREDKKEFYIQVSNIERERERDTKKKSRREKKTEEKRDPSSAGDSSERTSNVSDGCVVNNKRRRGLFYNQRGFQR